MLKNPEGFKALQIVVLLPILFVRAQVQNQKFLEPSTRICLRFRREDYENNKKITF